MFDFIFGVMAVGLLISIRSQLVAVRDIHERQVAEWQRSMRAQWEMLVQADRAPGQSRASETTAGPILPQSAYEPQDILPMAPGAPFPGENCRA